MATRRRAVGPPPPPPVTTRAGKGRATGPGARDNYGGNGPSTGDLPEVVTDPPVPVDPTPRQYNPRPPIRHRTETTIAQNAVLPVIYGKVRTGAIVRYDKVISGFSLLVYRICWGPVQSITNIKIDGKTLTQLGLIENVHYAIHLGTKTQTIDPFMALYEPNWIGGSPGVAYVVIRFQRATSTQAVPNVYQFQCDVEGMQVFDPSQDSTLATRYYRPLPALCLADYLTSKRYGCARPLSRVYSSSELLDSIDWNGEDLGSGRLRHTLGIKVDDSKPSSEWIEILRGSGQLLKPVWNGGQWHISPDKPRSASSITFTDQGAEANIKEVSPLRVKGSSEIATRVRVSYVDQTKEFRPDWAEDEDADIATDDEDLVVKEYDYQLPSYDQAKRIAKFIRARSRVDKSGRIRVLAEGEQVLPGLVCPVTVLQWNQADVDSLVKRVSPDGLGWWLDIEPYVDVWSDTEETNTTFIPPDNPSPYDVPDPPVSPASAGTLTLGDGFEEDFSRSPTVGVAVSFLPNWPFPLRYRITVESSLFGVELIAHDNIIGDAPVFVPLDLISSWTIRVYAIVAATGIISTTALAGTVDPRTDFTFPTPEWPKSLSIALPADGRVTLSITKPPKRVRVLYDTTYWAQTGIASFDGTKINDGNTSVAAGVVTNNDTLTLDFGAGQSKTIREVRASFSSFTGAALDNDFPIEWVKTSDDGSTFSGELDPEVNIHWIGFAKVGDLPVAMNTRIEDLGDHRAMRFSFNETALQTTFTLSEFQVFEYEAEETDEFLGYNIYDISTGTERFYTFVPKDHDFSAAPIDITHFTRNETTWSDFRVAVRVRTVGLDGTLSDPLDKYRGWGFSAGTTPSQLLTSNDVQEVRSKEIGDTSNTIGGVAITTYIANAISTAVTGLLDFKGATDCSANPNYPAASKGDSYVVSVAGKIGGASGKSVDIGDVYIASADNAGGTEASVGTSWFVLEHNLAGALLAANNLSDLASASSARANLGVGTGDSPEFTGVNIGHASDTTLTRPSAGNVAVEGNLLYRAGGTDVPVADGGTGASTAAGARSNLGIVDWAAITYASGNYTANGGTTPTWGVDSGEHFGAKYALIGKTMLLDVGQIQTSDVGAAAGAPTALRFTLPNGATAATSTWQLFLYRDAGGALTLGIATVSVGTTYVSFAKLDGSAWTVTSADNTYIICPVIAIETT